MVLHSKFTANIFTANLQQIYSKFTANFKKIIVQQIYSKYNFHLQQNYSKFTANISSLQNKPKKYKFFCCKNALSLL